MMMSEDSKPPGKKIKDSLIRLGMQIIWGPTEKAVQKREKTNYFSKKACTSFCAAAQEHLSQCPLLPSQREYSTARMCARCQAESLLLKACSAYKQQS